MKRNIRGFTLIELMMVSAIIGLLASIAIPKFANLILKAKEASVRGKLGALRSAVTIYYADNEGIYPNTSSPEAALTGGGKYLEAVPTISIPTSPQHAPSSTIFSQNFSNDWVNKKAWRLNPLSKGQVTVNCTHADSKGFVWSTY